MKEQYSAHQQGEDVSPSLLVIDGPLPGNRQFAKPLSVQVYYDEGEVIVSESRFAIHASGSTIAEALSAFRRIFSGYLDVLAPEEKELDAYMLAQLDYLRSYIRAA